VTGKMKTDLEESIKRESPRIAETLALSAGWIKSTIAP
jgi:hypothetical protein